MLSAQDAALLDALDGFAHVRCALFEQDTASSDPAVAQAARAAYTAAVDEHAMRQYHDSVLRDLPHVGSWWDTVKAELLPELGFSRSRKSCPNTSQHLHRSVAAWRAEQESQQCEKIVLVFVAIG